MTLAADRTLGGGAGDARPQFRVAIFGLGHKFQRLLEIVLRHARHNQYRYVLAEARGPGEYDIALVDMTAKGGPEVASTLRRMPQASPVVKVGRRDDAVRGRDDLLQSTFTMNLLKTLNQVVEDILLGRSQEPAADGASMVIDGEPDSPRGPRALLVDDSPTVRRQLAVALQRMGVGSAAEALDALAKRRYELVFVDVIMPVMDGYQLTRAIKREPATRGTPVVILTSRSSPFDLARGALAGCNSYLVKPVALQSLRDTVFRHLRKPAAAGGRLRLSP
jgi:two-component system cell cycle response regulator